MSIKAHTHMPRIDPGSRVHKLNIKSPLPAQEIRLSVSKNKEQLYKMMVTILTHLKTAPDTTLHTLVATGANPVPILIVTVNGQSVKIRRADLQTTHEEADIIVVQQAINVSQAGGTGVQITVGADDTDRYVCSCCISTTNWIVRQPYIWNLPKKIAVARYSCNPGTIRV